MKKPTKKQKISALNKSIAHWKNDHEKLIMFGGYKEYAFVFSSTDCGLCQLHISLCRKYKSDNVCGECPLIDCDGEGCWYGSQWLHARVSHDKGDKPGFMAARKNMIRRMERALKREESGKSPEKPA